MNTFPETSQEKLTELLGNLTNFQEKNNISAATRVRKNAQELKGLLQVLRTDVLADQKKRKAENKKNKKNKKPKKEEGDGDVEEGDEE